MEVWKDIPNYVGIYMISNLGRIEILERKVKNRNGYRIVKRQIKIKKTIWKMGKGWIEWKLH